MADPFADLIDTPAPIGAADPFADLLAPAPPPAGSPAPAGASRAPATARLPEDFDPFADTTSPPPHGTAAKDPSLGDLVGDRSASPGSLDILFDLSEASPSKRDALEEFLAPSAAADAPLPSDPFAFLSPDASSKRDNTGPAAADHTPALQAAYRPPPVRHPVPDVLIEPAPAAADVPAAPASPHPAPTPDAVLWTAFCEGARVRLPGQQHLTPELMRLIGATLRQAVEGTVQLSAARTTTKQELHVPVTTIQAKNNNPLKFAPDGASALAMLLQPPMRGFMAAPEAVQDAMADLLGHTVGTMAGTRAAIEGMLRRFEPAQLEKQLSSGGVLDTLVPMNRRAKLWELYLQHYDRISEGAREDFQELFGRAFIKAYEEQADRVAAAQRGRR
jgi:type VI secretion system FHA domain protein